MTIARSLKAVLAASVCLLPLQALAQSNDSFDVGDKPPVTATPPAPPQNWITLGGQYQTAGSDYLNRYSGAVNPGFYGLGDFHLGARDSWDTDGSHYWSIDGRDMGLPSRSVTAKIGQQGTWGLSFSYEGVPYFGTNDFKSVFTQYGTLVPGVAPGSVTITPGATWPRYMNAGAFGGVQYRGTTNTFLPQSGDPGLSSQLYNYQIGTQRDIFTSGGKYQWEDWTIAASWRHEHKSGYYANSAVFGSAPSVYATSAANYTSGGAAYFAQPIDYDTDRFDLSAALGNPQYQFQVSYMFSNFKDNLSTLNLTNPFAFPSAATQSAVYVLPPSNSAHQIKLMFGYNFSPTMRLNANFAYGLQLQNDPYATATGDSATQGTSNVNNGLLNGNRSSFNGLVQTIFGNVALTAQPLPKLDLRLAYTIDDRDNQSPRNAYYVLQRSDTNTDCATAPGSALATCSNLPFSYQKQTVVAEASYRILPQTKFTLNDTFDYTWRNYTDTTVVTTNKITAKIRSALIESVFGTLSYSHEDRDAHNYNNMAWWAYQNGTNATGIPGQQYELPGLLMYFEASRVHDDVKATLDVSPNNTLTGSLLLKFSNDRYPDGSYGLRNNHNIVVGPDVTWQATPALNVHAFYEYQQLFYDQTSSYQSSNNPATPPNLATTGYIVPWTAKTTDSVHTVGVNADWQAIADVLKFSFDYSFSYGDTAYALGDGGALFGATLATSTTYASAAMQQLPDVTSMLNMVSVRGEYTFRPNMALIFGYAFEKFNYKDFMNGTSATQYANFLLPGTLNPNDTIHVVGLGMRVRF